MRSTLGLPLRLPAWLCDNTIGYREEPWQPRFRLDRIEITAWRPPTRNTAIQSTVRSMFLSPERSISRIRAVWQICKRLILWRLSDPYFWAKSTRDREFGPGEKELGAISASEVNTPHPETRTNPGVFEAGRGRDSNPRCALAYNGFRD